MGGLLLRAVGGALSGAGDAMVTRAKQAREDTLLALKRGQEVEDRDAGFKQQNTLADTNNTAAMDRTNAEIGGSAANAKLAADTSIKTTGMNNETSTANTRATIAGEDKRTDKTIGAQKDIAKMRTDSYNAKTAAIASQYNKATTWNQALTTARQAYKDNPGAFTEADGTPTAPDKAIADIAASLLAKQPAPPISTVATPGGPALGGLMSNFTPSPSLSFPSAPSAPAPGPVTPPPAVAPPTGAVDMLKKNPSLKADFDQKYGQGAAARALGQ